MKISYHRLFDSDVTEAAGWYETRSGGLGDRFIESVRLAVERVTGDPESFAANEAGIRYVQTRRFPYVLLFNFDVDTLNFLGVLHTARSIVKWRERLVDPD